MRNAAVATSTVEAPRAADDATAVHSVRPEESLPFSSGASRWIERIGIERGRERLVFLEIENGVEQHPNRITRSA